MADNAGRKRKKAAYFAKCAAKRSKNNFTLDSGVKGFLATCNHHEKDCVREAINILTEFADKVYGEDKTACTSVEPKNKKIVFKDSDSEDNDKSDEDIESALAREVCILKQERRNDPSKRRFHVVESGAANCVFIRSTVEDPVLLVESILKEIETLAKQKTRFLLRLIPIEATCKAWPDEIKAALGPILDRYFKGDPKTFCVVFKRRNNNNVLRDELIQDIANEIKLRNLLHRADMKQPDLAVIVEVIRNICCLSVVPKYFHYRKYNLVEVAKPKTPNEPTIVKPEVSVKVESETTDETTHGTPLVEDSTVSHKISCQAEHNIQEESNNLQVKVKAEPGSSDADNRSGLVVDNELNVKEESNNQYISGDSDINSGLAVGKDNDISVKIENCDSEIMPIENSGTEPATC